MSIEQDVNRYKTMCMSSIKKINSLDASLSDSDFRSCVNKILADLSEKSAELRTASNRGEWSEEEKRTMIELYGSLPKHEAYEKAAKTLNRTAQQVRSMASNMGLA